MNRLAGAILVVVLTTLAPAGWGSEADDVAHLVDALLEQMTLEEKIGQLNQYSNSFELTGPPADDHRRVGR